MANIPSNLVLFSAANALHLRACCEKLIEERHEKQTSVAVAVSWSEDGLSKWLSGARNLPPERYTNMLLFLASRGVVEEENYDKVFVGIADFLGHRAEETFARVTDFVGNYVVYRYSMLAPGYVLKGSLQIFADPSRKALRTTEHYRIQAEMLTRIKGQPERSRDSQQLSKVDDLNFPRSGYFFPRSQDSYIIISKKTNRRENAPVEIQTVYFDSIYESMREPKIMQGIVSDWHGDRYYTTRVVMHKLVAPLPADQVRTLEPDDVNDVVNSYLTRRTEEQGSFVSYP